MKILIVTDGSEHSEYAIEDTIKFPWAPTSEFKIITVIDNSFIQLSGNEMLKTRAQKLVDQSVEKLQKGLSAEYKISGQVLEGYPKSEIVKCAEYWPADLIIMGSRGRKGLKRVVLGSVSHSVLLAANCSVRIARLSNTAEPNKIIIALDDSPVYETIIDRLSMRTWPKNVEFLCLTAIPTITEYFYGVQDSHEIGSLENAHQERTKLAKAHLEKVSQVIKSKIPNASVSWEVLEGDPREVVVEKAKEWNAALIVVGHKGKNWVDRLLIGSISEGIATWAECSVLVVK